MIRVEGVMKTYHDPTSRPFHALGPVDLLVHEGEFVTIVGPSGCGKSTLLTLLAGLEVPTTGRILVDDNEIKGPNRQRTLVPQSYSLFPWLTVYENVAFGLRLVGLPEDHVRSSVQHYLALVGLDGFATRYPNQLSGGMKQRVAIARALALRPRLLLMDEPFGALDAQTRQEMQALLRAVWQADKTTVVFVTHDVEEALYLADRVIIMTGPPGVVREIIEPPFPRERTLEVKDTPEFVRLRRRVTELLQKGNFALQNKASL